MRTVEVGNDKGARADSQLDAARRVGEALDKLPGKEDRARRLADKGQVGNISNRLDGDCTSQATSAYEPLHSRNRTQLAVVAVLFGPGAVGKAETNGRAIRVLLVASCAVARAV